MQENLATIFGKIEVGKLQYGAFPMKLSFKVP